MRRTLPAFNGPLICLSYTAVDPPRGIAPRSFAYRADTLLLSYREMDGGGRDRTGAWAAYETAAFPLGYPAIGEWWVVTVTLRRWPFGRLFYRQLTIFT